MATIEHSSRLVHEIYEAAVELGNWAVALDDISSAVGATGCALLISDPAQYQISVKSVGADPASMVAYNDYYGRLDPSPSALQRQPIGMVLPSEQLHDRDLLTRSEFFHDWADPNDYGDGAYPSRQATIDSAAGLRWTTVPPGISVDGGLWPLLCALAAA